MSGTRIVVKSNLFQGIAMPFVFNSSGNIALQQDHDLVQNELVQWLLTAITETFMEPNDGVGLEGQLYNPNDSATFVVLADYIRNRLDELEPRVELQGVELRRSDDPGDETKIIALITYRIPALIDSEERASYQFEVRV